MVKLNDAVNIDINTNRDAWVLQDTIGNLHIQVDSVTYSAMLDRLLEDVPIEHQEWRSKYNNYVVYDYPPFCEAGFMRYVIISAGTWQQKKFIGMIVKTNLDASIHLEACWKLSTNRKEPV